MDSQDSVSPVVSPLLFSKTEPEEIIEIEDDDEEQLDVNTHKRVFKEVEPEKKPVAAATKKYTPPNRVICISRRTDAVADLPQLKRILEGLRAGSITIHHPYFSQNKTCEQMTTINFKPGEVKVLSFFSKDYANLINLYPEYADVLDKYKWHISFTLNGEAGSVLEPGLTTTFADRLEQLRWFVEYFKSKNQPINSSIMVHVDPISLYKLPGDETVYDTLGTFPLLCETMHKLGIRRIHFSFYQFGWKKVCSRQKKLANAGIVDILKLSFDKKEDKATLFKLLQDKVFKHIEAAGIQLQTCTADEAVMAFPEFIKMGACVGMADIGVIADVPFKSPPSKKTPGERHCVCYPFKDLGDAHEPCVHGCRYCFMHPENYDF